MNIHTDLHKRLKDLIKSAGHVPPLDLKGSLQPVIDWHKIQKKPADFIATVAGNVGVTISPGKGKKYEWHIAKLELTNDGTVATRYIKVIWRNLNNTNIYAIIGSACSASESQCLSIGPAVGDSSGAMPAESTGFSQEDWIGLNYPIETYEEDDINITTGNGQAGDSLEYCLRLYEYDVPLEN